MGGGFEDVTKLKMLSEIIPPLLVAMFEENARFNSSRLYRPRNVRSVIPDNMGFLLKSNFFKPGTCTKAVSSICSSTGMLLSLNSSKLNMPLREFTKIFLILLPSRDKNFILEFPLNVSL